MNTLETNIKRTTDKLQVLLKQHQQIVKENEQLTLQITLLKSNKVNDLNQIAQLEQQVSILKFAVGNMDDIGKKLFEKNINQYIKDIDKCIGLLSE